MSISDSFSRFARASANALGSPSFFVANCGLILVWAVAGPVYHFSDTWQLVVNTGTTVLTYLAVFLIQNTQNRDAKTVHLKLDELISSLEGARNRFVDLEDLTDAELNRLQTQFRQLQIRANANVDDASRAFPGDPEREPRKAPL